MQKPIKGRIYQHFKGTIYCVLGFATDEETKEEVVIYCDTSNGKNHIRKVSTFFTEHPQLKVPRFQLVTPVNTKAK